MGAFGLMECQLYMRYVIKTRRFLQFRCFAWKKWICGKFVKNPLFVFDDVINFYWAGRFSKIIILYSWRWPQLMNQGGPCQGYIILMFPMTTRSVPGQRETCLDLPVFTKTSEDIFSFDRGPSLGNNDHLSICFDYAIFFSCTYPRYKRQRNMRVLCCSFLSNSSRKERQ